MFQINTSAIDRSISRVRRTPVPTLLGALILVALTSQTGHAASYRLLLESDTDTTANNEVFLTSFASFDDLVNSPPTGGVGTFAGINIAPGFSVGGLAHEFDPGFDPSPVPAPASLPVLAGGLAMLGAVARRRRTSR